MVLQDEFVTNILLFVFSSESWKEEKVATEGHWGVSVRGEHLRLPLQVHQRGPRTGGPALTGSLRSAGAGENLHLFVTVHCL